MSMYSDAATIAERRPPLPTSTSELTLAHSTTGSNKSTQDDNPLSKARSFMNRSSRMLLKKKSSKSSLSRTNDWVDATQAAKIQHGATQCRTTHHGRAESDATKHRISQPFDFQHLTHTIADPTAADNSRILAGKPSRELKGIRTFDLADYISTTDATNELARRPELLRATRSVDSFPKRMSRCSFSSPNPPTIVPPRRSSRKPTLLQVSRSWISDQDSPTVPDFVMSAPYSRTSWGPKATSPRSPLSISTGADDSPLGMMGIAQAVTTPDESAYVVKSEVASPLEDVPEEEDNSHVNANRMLRSGSDPVLPEGAEKGEEIPVRGSKRVSGHIASGIFLDLDVDWDEDIDYCYDQLEADGHDTTSKSPDHDTDSPASDTDFLFMKGRNKTNRTSRTNVPLHLRRIQSQVKEQGLDLDLSTIPLDANTNIVLSPATACSDDYSDSKSSLPLFTPDMTGDLDTFYSPRSSFSQMSKYPSGGSSHAVSTSDSKRDYDLATIENSSTTSVPELLSSSKRKSTSTKHSSMYSQKSVRVADHGMGPAAADVALPPSRQSSRQNAVLLDAPEVPQRKRSLSDSAGKVLTSAMNKQSLPVHTRSTSYAVGSGSSKSPKAPYALFPPLDRIGATPARA